MKITDIKPRDHVVLPWVPEMYGSKPPNDRYDRLYVWRGEKRYSIRMPMWMQRLCWRAEANGAGLVKLWIEEKLEKLEE